VRWDGEETGSCWDGWVGVDGQKLAPFPFTTNVVASGQMRENRDKWFRC
jgi:hypothetical protein